MFTDLLLYIKLKKFTLLRFYFIFTFSLLFTVVIDSRDFDILKVSRALNKPRYNKFLIIY